MQDEGAARPFRIEFIAQGNADTETIAEQVMLSSRVPMIEPRAEHDWPLAIVGGGPSTAAALDELKGWFGQIWAINGAASYLAAAGIDSVMVSVDPLELSPWMFEGVKHGLFASCAHPTTFEAMEGHCNRFHMSEYHEAGVGGGCTTASRLPMVALLLGYRQISYFGCEGSFVDVDHAYENRQGEEQLIVRAGGKLYRTYPEFLIQSENLAELMIQLPHLFKNRSGGLLQAIIENKDTWEVAAVSEALKAKLEGHNGDTGLYADNFDWK